MARILVIDDDVAFNRLIEEYLIELGHQVITAHNGREGFSRFESDTPDIVISDIRMPKSDGLDLLLKIRNHDSHIPKGIILMSGLGNAQNENYIGTIQALGATDLLQKPFPLSDLSEKIAQILAK